MLGKQLAASLGISQSEVSESLERSRFAGLLDDNKMRVNTLALREFLLYGVKYCFPIQPGNLVRGVLTFVSASPVKEQLSAGSEVFVWPDPEGEARGQSVIPLYPTVPAAVKSDNDFYKLMVIVDTLRIGRTREVAIATEELDKYLKRYGEGQSKEA